MILAKEHHQVWESFSEVTISNIRDFNLNDFVYPFGEHRIVTPLKPFVAAIYYLKLENRPVYFYELSGLGLDYIDCRVIAFLLSLYFVNHVGSITVTQSTIQISFI